MRYGWLLGLAWMGFAGADQFRHLSGTGRDEAVDKARFSTTAKWDRKYLDWSREQTRFLPANWRREIVLPAPPANSSERTKAELAELVRLRSERGPRLERIRAEVELTSFRFGKHDYGELTTSAAFPETAKLLKAAYADTAIAIFHFKKQHDRVRPSVLASALGMELEPAIEIPAHPAYPSGHATGAHMIAYLLQELDPGNAERYRADAAEIGRNREVAGVHYVSDTEAGRLLARQIVDGLLANAEFRRLLESARAEWQRTE